MNSREKPIISWHWLWTILKNCYFFPCQANVCKVKSCSIVKEGKTIFFAPKQEHHDNQNAAISPCRYKGHSFGWWPHCKAICFVTWIGWLGSWKILNWGSREKKGKSVIAWERDRDLITLIVCLYSIKARKRKQSPFQHPHPSLEDVSTVLVVLFSRAGPDQHELCGEDVIPACQEQQNGCATPR